MEVIIMELRFKAKAASVGRRKKILVREGDTLEVVRDDGQPRMEDGWWKQELEIDAVIPITAWG